MNQTNDIFEYGILIQQKRKELFLTEERVAELADISDRELRNIESGVVIPKLDSVIKLGFALDMDLGELNVLYKVKASTSASRLTKTPWVPPMWT